jgi:8-oxo-dGTP diphosphatase
MTSKKTVIAPDFDRNPIEVSIDKLKWRPAAYGIVVKDNQILLLKQTNGYDLPGGGLEYGETPEEAVIREIKEETGIAASNPRLIDCGTAYFKAYSQEENYYQAIAMYYKCDYISGDLSKEGFDELEQQFAEEPVWLYLKWVHTESIEM